MDLAHGLLLDLRRCQRPLPHPDSVDRALTVLQARCSPRLAPRADRYPASTPSTAHLAELNGLGRRLRYGKDHRLPPSGRSSVFLSLAMASVPNRQTAPKGVDIECSDVSNEASGKIVLTGESSRYLLPASRPAPS